MLQHMWKTRGVPKRKRQDADVDDFEIYLIELSDAFCTSPSEGRSFVTA